MKDDSILKLIDEAEGCIDRGDFERADTVFLQLINVTSELRFEAVSEGIADILSQTRNAQSRLERLRADYVPARIHAQEALDIALEHKIALQQARAIINLGHISLEQSEADQALQYFQRAADLAEQLGDKDLHARAVTNSGLVYLSLRQFENALEKFMDAFTTFEALGNRRMLAANHHNVASCLLGLLEYRPALEHFSKALAINEEMNNPWWISYNLGGLGGIRFDLQEYSQALEYYLRALSIMSELGLRRDEASTAGNIGVCYYYLKDYTAAQEYLQRSLAIYEELDDVTGVAQQTGGLGLVYKVRGEVSNALACYRKALSLHKDSGQLYGVAQNTGNIGSLLAMQDYEGYDPVEAEELLRSAISLFSDLGEIRQRSEFHEQLYFLYKNQGRFAEALFHAEQFHHLEREMSAEEAKREMDRLDYERKEAEREKTRLASKIAAEAEMNATRDLLHKVLPASIATRMLKGETIADYYPMMSILFADIVGFTPIAARMPARTVLAFLNYIFGEFDRIMEKHGCQKIKTIGDGYMAVCGAPIECADHAERLARAALELMKVISLPEELRKHLPKDSHFHIRIGLHTGSAFAGIVGEKGFTYDVYSDAVNLASRMESHGEAGKIHCSEEFAMHVQNRVDIESTEHPFRFEERGVVEIKGKGMMRTYFLQTA